jgi:hypothetical protein
VPFLERAICLAGSCFHPNLLSDVKNCILHSWALTSFDYVQWYLCCADAELVHLAEIASDRSCLSLSQVEGVEVKPILFRIPSNFSKSWFLLPLLPLLREVEEETILFNSAKVVNHLPPPPLLRKCLDAKQHKCRPESVPYAARCPFWHPQWGYDISRLSSAVRIINRLAQSFGD